jgi:hypothetical protein
LKRLARNPELVKGERSPEPPPKRALTARFADAQAIAQAEPPASFTVVADPTVAEAIEAFSWARGLQGQEVLVVDVQKIHGWGLTILAEGFTAGQAVFPAFSKQYLDDHSTWIDASASTTKLLCETQILDVPLIGVRVGGYGGNKQRRGQAMGLALALAFCASRDRDLQGVVSVPHFADLLAHVKNTRLRKNRRIDM